MELAVFLFISVVLNVLMFLHIQTQKIMIDVRDAQINEINQWKRNASKYLKYSNPIQPDTSDYTIECNSWSNGKIVTLHIHH
jgi:hypothetical protein